MTEQLDTAVVAGLFALLGAFAGAFLARRTEYLSWLRQNRSETFAEFLAKLSHAQNRAIDFLQDHNLEPLIRDIRVTEAYAVPEDYGRVVKLYLPRSVRAEFAQLVREVRALHSSVGLGDSRLETMQRKIERIEQIFQHAVDG